MERSRSVPFLDNMTSDLPRRLREETAELHRGVEDAVDLPASVRTRGDYAELLGRFLDLHAHLERRLASPPWRVRWTQLGIDIARYARSDLLVADLTRLDAAPSPRRPERLPPLRTFGEALGCLYVLEGSSLGGRVLAPAIRSTVGDVPVSFLIGQGRRHPEPWQAVRQALRLVDPREGDPVVLGARETFAAFGAHLRLGSARVSGTAG